MMKTILLYNHSRNIFKGSDWKPGITKWFDDPIFEGCESGNFGAMISVSNYDDVKDKLPKTLKPIETWKEN